MIINSNTPRNINNNGSINTPSVKTPIVIESTNPGKKKKRNSIKSKK